MTGTLTGHPMDHTFPYRSEAEKDQLLTRDRLIRLRGEEHRVCGQSVLKAMKPGSRTSFSHPSLQTTARLWQDSPHPATDHAALRLATQLSLPQKPDSPQTSEDATQQHQLLLAAKQPWADNPVPKDLHVNSATAIWLTHWLILALNSLDQNGPVNAELLQAGERLLPHVAVHPISANRHEREFLTAAHLDNPLIGTSPDKTHFSMMKLVPSIWRPALLQAGRINPEVTGDMHDLPTEVAGAARTIMKDPEAGQEAWIAAQLLRSLWTRAWPALREQPPTPEGWRRQIPVISAESLPGSLEHNVWHQLHWLLRAVNQTSELLIQEWASQPAPPDLWQGSSHVIWSEREQPTKGQRLLTHRLGLLRALTDMSGADSQNARQTQTCAQLALLAAHSLEKLISDPLSGADRLTEAEIRRVRHLRSLP